MVSAQAAAKRMQLELDRQQALAAQKFASQQTLEQAQANRDQSAAAVDSAQAAIDAAAANLDVLKAQQQEAARTLDELKTALAKAERDLSFTVIRAPVDGVFGNRAVQTGDYVQTGQRVASLVPLDDVYIDANFKETQLARLQPGQPVSISVDALPDHDIAGRVASLSPASGAVFSLLPPDNATGNFTKIVQRLPVRIEVPADVAAQAAAAARHVGRGQRQHQAGEERDQDRAGGRGRSALTLTRRAMPIFQERIMASAVSGFSGNTGAAHAGCRAASARPSPAPIPPRRLFAFLAMCFGMFMAFLDIQIVSSSLAEIQAGLSASADEIPWVQTSYLIAEVIAIPLSGFLSRALGTRILFADLGRRLHARQHHVRHRVLDRQHDRVAGAAGLHRRRHGADGVRLGLSDLPGPAAETHRAGGRPDRDLGADRRPDGRRLSDRRLFVALAVLHQCHPRHHRQRGDVPPGRFRPARFRAAEKFRLVPG